MTGQAPRCVTAEAVRLAWRKHSYGTNRAGMANW